MTDNKAAILQAMGTIKKALVSDTEALRKRLEAIEVERRDAWEQYGFYGAWRADIALADETWEIMAMLSAKGEEV